MKKYNFLKIAVVYTGIVLGAGFASGQELLSFFVKYGGAGIIGLIVSGLIFSLCGWAVLDICHTCKITNYRDFIRHVMGGKLASVIELSVAVFLIVLFATMLAAAGASLSEGFGTDYSFGVMLLGIICYIIFMFDLDGLIRINSVLAPVMLVGGIFIGIYTFIFDYTDVFIHSIPFAKTVDNWFMKAVIYASYNTVTAVSLLTSLHKLNTDRKTAKWGGITGGACMAVLGVCMSLPLLLNLDNVMNKEIPLLFVVKNHGAFAKYFYLIILCSAIITSAAGNGYAFVEWLSSKLNVNRTLIKLSVVLLAMAMANVGFSRFVGTVYPFFGVVGFLEIVFIFVFVLRRRRICR